MPRYVIERDIPEIGSAERDALRGAAQKSNGVLADMKAEKKNIQWEHTYVAGDKTFCIYLADERGAHPRARRAQRVSRHRGHRGAQDDRPGHRRGLKAAVLFSTRAEGIRLRKSDSRRHYPGAVAGPALCEHDLTPGCARERAPAMNTARGGE